ncbi:MAG TPA: hypothetical protein VIV58_08625, partial [Kofleriaceae bacterium]
MACRLLYSSAHIMRTDPMPHFAGWTTAAVAALVAVVVTAIFTGCAASPAGTSDPNSGLLRDFLDGKYDGAGHPINARVTEAEAICANAGTANDTTVSLTSACTAKIAGGEQSGDLVASARLAVRGHASSGDIATVEILDASGSKLASETLTVARLRAGEWIDWPVAWSSTGAAVQLRITPAAGAQLDFDYVEVFPQRFGLVLAPGS